jgi:hypothetical protein
MDPSRRISSADRVYSRESSALGAHRRPKWIGCCILLYDVHLAFPQHPPGDDRESRSCPMQVMVHVDRSIAQSLRGEPQRGEAFDLLTRAQELGVTLRPLRFPTEGFAVEVPDRETAERVAEELAVCEGVEAAYFTPPVELP